MPVQQRTRRVLIMGAAGRDFHNFNVMFRHDPSYEVAENPKQLCDDRTEVFGCDAHAPVMEVKLYWLDISRTDMTNFGFDQVSSGVGMILQLKGYALGLKRNMMISHSVTSASINKR